MTADAPLDTADVSPAAGSVVDSGPVPLDLDPGPADQDAPATPKGRRPLSDRARRARQENGRKGGRPPKAVVTATQRSRRVESMYAQIGGMMAMFGCLVSPRAPQVGFAMVAAAPDLGTAWAEWADNSPAIARTIDALTTGGAAGAVLIAHAPIVAAALNPPDPGAAGVSGLADLIAGMTDAPPPG